MTNIHIEKLTEISSQISELNKEKEKYIQLHTSEILEYLKEKQAIDYKWFVDNFDYIWKYKDKLATDKPFSEIVIDFIQLYRTTGLQNGVAFNGSYNQMYLRDLITLWNWGYMYKGYPIISIKTIYHNDKRTMVSYVKDNSVVEEFTECDFNEYIPIVKNYALRCDNLNVWDGYKTIEILKRG